MSAPDGKSLLRHLSEYIDGAVLPSFRRRIDKHLAGCRPCRDFLRSFAGTVRLMRTRPKAAPTAADKRELRRRINRLTERKD